MDISSSIRQGLKQLLDREHKSGHNAIEVEAIGAFPLLNSSIGQKCRHGSVRGVDQQRELHAAGDVPAAAAEQGVYALPGRHDLDGDVGSDENIVNKLACAVSGDALP